MPNADFIYWWPEKLLLFWFVVQDFAAIKGVPMSQDKIYKVAALGLSIIEMRFVKIMLALTSHASTLREQGRYEWSDDLNSSDMVIVNADEENAMEAWHKLTDNKPSPILLLITATEHVPYIKYCILRPFGPSKILMMLDRVVREHMGRGMEAEIFSGTDKSAQRSRSTQEGAPARHRALVIDDSPTVRKSLVLELGCFNIKVDTAETGELGLEMLDSMSYDIIFLDVVMPGADGYQICKTIRKKQENKRTPIVMLTSKSSPFDKVRGSLAGCSSYLTKPVDYDNFFRVLEGYLAHVKEDLADSKKYA